MLARDFPTKHETHDYELGQTHWVCKRCGHAVKETHRNGLFPCIGVPSVPVVREKLLKHLTGKLVLIYNAAFDQPIIERQFGIEIETACVMMMYSEFVGDWSDYWGNYRWQRLPGGDHSAIGDCRATLRIIREMAAHTPEFRRSAFKDYSLIEKHLK